MAGRRRIGRRPATDPSPPRATTRSPSSPRPRPAGPRSPPPGARTTPTSTYSSGEWSAPPTGPSPSRHGTPDQATQQTSETPPVLAWAIGWPSASPSVDAACARRSLSAVGSSGGTWCRLRSPMATPSCRPQALTSASVRSRSAACDARMSTCIRARSGIAFAARPPRSDVTWTERPGAPSCSAATRIASCASASTGLRPRSGSVPACAARPIASTSSQAPPLRASTSEPSSRPHSRHSTASKPPTRSMVPNGTAADLLVRHRDELDPTEARRLRRDLARDVRREREARPSCPPRPGPARARRRARTGAPLAVPEGNTVSWWQSSATRERPEPCATACTCRPGSRSTSSTSAPYRSSVAARSRASSSSSPGSRLGESIAVHRPRSSSSSGSSAATRSCTSRALAAAAGVSSRAPPAAAPAASRARARAPCGAPTLP